MSQARANPAAHHPVDATPSTARQLGEGVTDALPSLTAAERFARQAELFPNAPALVSGYEKISYGELATQAEQVSRHLQAHGLQLGDLVAILSGRSIAFYVSALGVLKAGGAYLPLDPRHPTERRAWQFRDAQARFLIAATNLPTTAIADNQQTLRLQDLAASSQEILVSAQPSAVQNDAIAYVMYTSGSSGRPKAVEITHGNLSNLIDWHCHEFSISPQDRASHLAAISFDAAVWEVWPYLTSGASVHIVDEATAQNPQRYRDWLAQNQITMAFAPTHFCEQLLQLSWPPRTSLRCLLTGGDTLTHYPPVNLPFRLVNNYGPTECCVVATSVLIDAPEPQNPTAPPPIGRPIDNVSVHLLDEEKRAVPPGARGELWIAGAGVARGYRNRNQLTAQLFQEIDLDGRPRRAYRTGDWARLKPDGNLEFLGRADRQVKIRGFRIEPFEIESAIKSLPEIRECSVFAEGSFSGNEKTLTACLEAHFAVPSLEATVRQHLSTVLPEHMIPARLVSLAKLPRSASGKVDRALLADLVRNKSCAETDQSTGPASKDTEAALTEITTQLLKIPHLSPTANLFMAGGHSLLGAQLISRVRKFFGVDLGLRFLFEHPTIREISAEVQRLRADAGPEHLPEPPHTVLGIASRSTPNGD